MNVPMIDSRPYDRPSRYLVSLVHELCALPSETEWVEFKVNHAEPQAIGRYISALANTAALVGKERLLWRIFDHTLFEEIIAIERAGADDVLRLLDYPAYFDLLERPLPSNRDGILAALAEDQLIRGGHAGGWDITSLGAILFAKCLDAFHALRRKAVRVIHYRGLGRTDALKEHVVSKGYVSGFEGLIEYVNGLLPANEVIEQALRKSIPVFPELAVRELTANASSSPIQGNRSWIRSGSWIRRQNRATRLWPR